MPTTYGSLAISAAESFIRCNLVALAGEVRNGIYPDLRSAVQQDAELLRNSRKWFDRQMQTTDGYATLCTNGFAEATIINAFNNVMLMFYERVLYLSDPEAEEPIEINAACESLVTQFGEEFWQMKLADDGASTSRFCEHLVKK